MRPAQPIDSAEYSSWIVLVENGTHLIKENAAPIVAVVGTFTDCQTAVTRGAIGSGHRRVITKGSSSRSGPLFINVARYRVPELFRLTERNCGRSALEAGRISRGEILHSVRDFAPLCSSHNFLSSRQLSIDACTSIMNGRYFFWSKMCRCLYRENIINS